MQKRLNSGTLILLSVTMMIAGLNCKKEKNDSEPDVRGLIAYYSFDSNAQDGSNNANHGSLTNGAKIASKGKVNGALDLDGLNDYVSVRDSFRLSLSFTFSCWIRPDDVGGTAVIISKYQTPNFGPYKFYLDNNKVAAMVSTTSGSSLVIRSNGTVSADKWSHVAWVGKGNTMNIYINGVLDGSFQYPGLTWNRDRFCIGRQAYALSETAGAHSEFKGFIDELRIYDIDISPLEISKLFNQK
jgi:hypothetical protein